MDTRVADLARLYALLNDLEERVGARRRLADCDGRLAWPERGVYFFTEAGEMRSDSGTGPRIVRVGTHALASGSRTTLWTRLSQHRGQKATGGGNHRGSIFRLLIGNALIRRDGLDAPFWGVDSTGSRIDRRSELPLEQRVSNAIGAMSVLWLPIDDDAGPASARGYVERNAIALLSNFRRSPLDPPSPQWLGRNCTRERVTKSGIWNQNHVDEAYDPAFLDTLRQLIEELR